MPEGHDQLEPRDYDADHYVRQLREIYASRFARAFRPEDHEALFADPAQMSLFAPSVEAIRPVLTELSVSGLPAD